MLIPIDAVTIGSGRRKVIKENVANLVTSIGHLGLRTPITVLPADANGKYPLVTGRHRLEACRQLGMTEIEAMVIEDELAAEMWEIAENLHRGELTMLQRSLCVGRWIKLTAQKIKRDQKAGEVSVQVGPKPRPRSERGMRGQGVGGGRKESGTSAAARELGISEAAAKRAATIATHLTQAAQKEAERLGLDTNQKALLQAANIVGADQQTAALQRYATHLERQRQKKAEEAAVKRMLAPKVVTSVTATTPRTPREVFKLWMDSLEIDTRTEVMIWLRGAEFEAYCEDREKADELMRAGMKSLH